MYKDKEIKNVKNFFVNVWRKNIFDIYVTEYGRKLEILKLAKSTLVTIKWKTKNTTVGTIQNLNIKIVDGGKIDTPKTQIHDRSLTWFGTSIKSVWGRGIN
jgi:hypothetical protein